MAAPLDDMFLTWLYSQVGYVEAKDRSLTYWKLFRQLYTIEYVWLIHNDDARLEDAKTLRLEFLAQNGIDARDVDPDWLEIGCSVLELMVAMSRRLEFQAEKTSPYWFWILMDNIGLRRFTDATRQYPHQHVEDVVYTVIFRQYTRHGTGGFFPLSGPCEDQRSVELWYQLSAYVLELTA